MQEARGSISGSARLLRLNPGFLLHFWT